MQLKDSFGFISLLVALFFGLHYIIKRRVSARLNEIDPIVFAILVLFGKTKYIAYENYCVQFFRYTKYFIHKPQYVKAVTPYVGLVDHAALNKYTHLLVQKTGTFNSNLNNYLSHVWCDFFYQTTNVDLIGFYRDNNYIGITACLDADEDSDWELFVLKQFFYDVLLYYITHFQPDESYYHDIIWNQAIKSTPVELTRTGKTNTEIILEPGTIIPDNCYVSVDLIKYYSENNEIELFIKDFITHRYHFEKIEEHYDWRKITVI